MRNDTRLSRMLHVLIHMARHEQPATSDTLALMLRTNPVVIRRTMALLKEQGYVRSEKGHRGGWTLAKPLSEMTLLDIHEALGSASLFAIGLSTDHPECLVEQAVNAALTDAFDAAQALLIERLGSVTLEQLADDFEERFQSLGSCEGGK
ncbi:Rrf2 family transcriptional regulator [Pseudomonas sp. 7P_10.2_Bac1]|uniref:Rrf2 family transcriptional regulator n=1 Tax=Pseudomonas sp. 7P_10.2_Bac1 TaxID=2971614 RepID=UPI0021C75705|nr:Rrf2 family transcriptional regulator [Pseudomonas sp. 7P_10.2_Bac1]MCU1726327.1 Rrf2 family transcriptional regulator [Pseudomonas sp. 7P_10.2_Bac1]